MTQCERVLQYLNDFGAINPQQALSDLGIMRLGARIWDLRRRGHQIRREMVAGKNRYGEPVTFAEYRLDQEDEETNQSSANSC